MYHDSGSVRSVPSVGNSLLFDVSSQLGASRDFSLTAGTTNRCILMMSLVPCGVVQLGGVGGDVELAPILTTQKSTDSNQLVTSYVTVDDWR